MNPKDQFIAIVCGVADDFMFGIWYVLLPQIELTFNLLHQSNVDLNVSANAHLTEPYYFNKIPLEPLKCALLIHDKPVK